MNNMVKSRLDLYIFEVFHLVFVKQTICAQRGRLRDKKPLIQYNQAQNYFTSEGGLIIVLHSTTKHKTILLLKEGLSSSYIVQPGPELMYFCKRVHHHVCQQPSLYMVVCLSVCLFNNLSTYSLTLSIGWSHHEFSTLYFKTAKFI